MRFSKCSSGVWENIWSLCGLLLLCARAWCNACGCWWLFPFLPFLGLQAAWLGSAQLGPWQTWPRSRLKHQAAVASPDQRHTPQPPLANQGLDTYGEVSKASWMDSLAFLTNQCSGNSLVLWQTSYIDVQGKL